MATLWTFGDSFTEYYHPSSPTHRNWRDEYIEWKGYIPKVYGEVIAEKLNMNLVNKGKNGCCNLYILEEFCKIVNQIKKDDIVIFGWTSQQRFRLPDKDNNWTYFNPELKEKNPDRYMVHGQIENFGILSKSTVIETLINRTNSIYSTEICNWINLINFALQDITTFHWSWFNYNGICGICQSKNYKTIKQETNNVVIDGHWCEKGHYQFAEFVIDRLANVKNLL